MIIKIQHSATVFTVAALPRLRSRVRSTLPLSHRVVVAESPTAHTSVAAGRAYAKVSRPRPPEFVAAEGGVKQTREPPAMLTNFSHKNRSRYWQAAAYGQSGFWGGNDQPHKARRRGGSPIGGWVTNERRFEPIYGAKQAGWDTPHEKETQFRYAKSPVVRFTGLTLEASTGVFHANKG